MTDDVLSALWAWLILAAAYWVVMSGLWPTTG